MEIEEDPSSSIKQQAKKKAEKKKKTSSPGNGNEEWLQGTPSDLRKKISLSNDAEDTNIMELGSLLGRMVASVTRQPAMAAALKALKTCRNDRRKAYAKLEELGSKTPKKDRKRQRLYSENIGSGGSTSSQEAEIIEQQQQNEKTKSAVKKRLVKSRPPTQQKSEQGRNTKTRDDNVLI